ncbi:Haem-binding domain-containing protein [Tenacibaculum sp. MAR_2009_124]|uniref:heme-binding domain-containing protein n=1 Tax=Tenacibaculum sp. MAR_2009_124 TaxID=1250059 RepID=UPI000894F29B|nr:heme-binding domain-containing protein [Tenacibaculum sp. MAR_2009_124]SEC80736.1 Haem-binding domain-containing protein [Tenacibaculum sp. MAR_2009_124]
MSILKKVGVVALGGVLIAQFFQPEQNLGEYESVKVFLAETKTSAEVETILKKACFDCHSAKTNYPWYGKITPINYWMAHHVEEGREHLDFSNWSNYSLKKKEHKMDEVHEEVEEKHMPLKSYTITHGDAKLTEEEIKTLVNWGKTVQGEYKMILEK